MTINHYIMKSGVHSMQVLTTLKNCSLDTNCHTNGLTTTLLHTKEQIHDSFDIQHGLPTLILQFIKSQFES